MRIEPYFALTGAAQDQLGGVLDHIGTLFAQSGYARVELPILLPASLYLDRAGEDIRQRIFIVSRGDGEDMALRADLTVPLCRQLIDDSSIAFPQKLTYRGPCFRSQSDDSGLPTEFLQTGIELLGVADAEGADLEALSLARGALARAGLPRLRLELGDVALFDAFIDGLELADVWRARLSKAFRHPSRLPKVLARLEEASSPGETAASTLEMDHLVVEQVLRHANIEVVGRRTIEEIGARLAVKTREAMVPKPPAETVALIRRLLQVDAPLADAMRQLEDLAPKSGPAFRALLTTCARRTQAFAAAMETADRVDFSATLGRKFNYYTGFTFNLWADGLAAPVASGGRYDTLMSDLGAARPVPAVGAAIWPERILAALGGQP